MKRKLNKNKLFYFIITLLIILVLAITGYKAYKDFFAPKTYDTKKVLDNLSLYGYTLDENDTKLYKSYFKELKEILKQKEIDNKEYAGCITKLFIADFYDLNSKLTSSDFGGLEFIHPDLIDNFKLNAGDTIYNHIKTNIDGKRKQELPQVKEVSIKNIEETTYKYNEKEYKSYKVKASWEYLKDLGYENEGEFSIIEDNNKLYIVEKLEG